MYVAASRSIGKSGKMPVACGRNFLRMVYIAGLVMAAGDAGLSGSFPGVIGITKRMGDNLFQFFSPWNPQGAAIMLMSGNSALSCKL